jgi:uncharacterized membrane protein YcaP (DUF421 family)
MLAAIWSNTILPDMLYSGMPAVLEKMIRPLLIYLFLIIGLRMAGKRELAQLNPFDFVVLMTLSNTVQNAIIGNDNTVLGGMIGAATLLLVNYAVVRLLHSHPRLERLVAGKRDFLIRDGVIQRDHLQKELISRIELTAAAHKQGIDSLEHVRSAILEPTGVITFFTKSPTPDDARHAELLASLNQISSELAVLRQARATTGGAS